MSAKPTATWTRNDSSADARPLVSVIVPVYNVERFLDQALASIEAQTLRDIEIICVNDGSTDRSPEIMREHAVRDDRVRVIDKPNGGYGSACNRGLREARGTWIAIVEPDDWIDPAMYERMTSFAAGFDGDIDIVKTPYWRVIDPDTPEQHLLNCSYKGRVKPKRQPFALTDGGVEHLLIHHPSIWSALYRADFLAERGIAFHEIPGAGWADNPFLVETLCQAHAIVYLDEAFYYYREETADKASSFAFKNASVPFERWHDMMDVLERLEVTDESILRVQYRRGFTYLDYIASEIDPNDPQMAAIMRKMFARMRDRLVMVEPAIPPAWKRLYCEVKGLPQPSRNPLPYYTTLAAASLYSMRNIGPAETLKLVGAGARRDQTAGSAQAQPHFSEPGGAATVAKGASDVPDVRLSIVIPAYNAERYLKDCLDSVTAQTHAPYEVVCVDDGSTDATLNLLEERAARDSRFVVVTKENGGPSSARNAGIRAATGDFICFLDADDALEPRACERITDEIARTGCDCIVFGWSCFPPETANEWLRARTNVRDAFYPRFSEELLFDEMTQPFLRVAVRRDVLIDNGIAFDEALRVGEDAAFLFALYPRANATKLISDKLYRYRMPHEGSITTTAYDGSATKCVDDLNMLVVVFQDWKKAGLLRQHSGKLVHWLVNFFLYTALRQPAPLRDELAYSYKLLLEANFTQDEILALDIPAHDFKLIDLILNLDGNAPLDTRELSQAMLSWRIAEYGPTDLLKTALSRL